MVARLDTDGTAALNRDLDRDRDELRADLREAYERGRSDERATKKRHPIFMTLLFASAAVGLVMLVLAGVNGSFMRAGDVVDQNLRIAAVKAEPQVRGAAAQAGQSLRDAGSAAKAKAADTVG